MKPRIRNSQYKSDQPLVADQPGMTILLSGLVIAIVIGLAVRGLISPTRIKPMLESAASHIHQDVAVRIESARVSLADGFLPEFSVVLNQVHMDSGNACWMSPRLFADEIRLPISLIALLNGKNPVARIQANEVELRFLSEKIDCGVNTVPALRNHSSSIESHKTVSIIQQKNEELSSYSDSDINGIEINRLLLVHEKYPKQSVDLLNLTFDVKSKKPRMYVLKATSHLIKGQNIADYLSKTNIHVEYKEFPDRNLLVHLFGNWREGHFSLNANYKPDEDLLSFDGDLKHIPASQIFSFLYQYGFLQREYNGKQIWFSMRSHLSGPLKQIKTLPAAIQDFSIEGDLGEISVDQIQVQQIDPLKIYPLSFDIRNLNIDRLYTLIQQDKPSSTLGKLGIFSGHIDFKDQDNFNLNGQLSGLELIFSNKGQREIQQINKIVTNIDYKKENWSLSFLKAEPVAGNFVGNIALKADKDFKKVDLKIKSDDLLFQPSVQKLMTKGGKVGSLKTNIQMNFQNGALVLLKGSAAMNELAIEGMEMNKLLTRFENNNDEIVISPFVQEIKITRLASVYDFLKPLADKAVLPNDGFVLKNMSSSFKTKNFQYLKWKSEALMPIMTSKYVSEGAWSENGELDGQLKVGQGKKSSNWIISGHRDQPMLTEKIQTKD